MVTKSDGCWLWTGPVGGHGYGHFSVERRQVRSHRMAWELSNGPIPSGMYVCHRCDVTLCVRPDHLFVGTHRDNNDDKVAKNRHTFGARMPWSKLTESEVLEIRRLHSEGGSSHRKLGQLFNVSPAAIGLIVRRKNWSKL
jgi:hypothetical protein